jgi:hypothetical protein
MYISLNVKHPLFLSDFNVTRYFWEGGGRSRGGAVGGDTALQARGTRFRFPMVSLDFFIDILPAALWPWG